MKILRRLLLAAALAAFGLGTAAAAYPDRPIRLIVPSSAGGSPDVLARLLAGPLGEEVGQTFIVEDLPGAAGIIGTDRVAKSPADGYTLLWGMNQIAVLNPPLYARLPYQVDRDLAPLGLILDLSYMWIANASAPFNTIGELVAYNRAHPGTVNYASTGPGSAAHLGGLMIEKMTGTSMNHIPYRANTNGDLMGGIVQLKLDPIAASINLVKSGKVKALAVSSPHRLAVLPNVPTVAETIPGYEMTGWQGLWAPAGTPVAIQQKLNAALVKVVHRPEIQARIRELGFEPLGSSPKEMADRIHAELAQWTRFIKQAGIRLDPQ